MLSTPKVFNWVGNGTKIADWHDPKNWAEGVVPNQKEAIAVFSASTIEDTTILIHDEVRVAQMWFSEKHSLTFESARIRSKSENDEPKFLFETSNQFSTLFFDVDNDADHYFKQRWILHSCIFGQKHRDKVKVKEAERNINTFHFDGKIGNYKDPDRASLQIYGNQIFQLNSPNTFKGPVVAQRNGRIRAMVNQAIPDGSPIVIDDGGELYLAEGVEVLASSLRLNGQLVEPGHYNADRRSELLNGFQSLTGPGKIVVRD